MADSSCLVVVAGVWGLSASSAARHRFNLEEARRQVFEVMSFFSWKILTRSNMHSPASDIRTTLAIFFTYGGNDVDEL